MVAISFIQDRRHRPVVLHTLLYPVFCPDAAANQRGCQRHIMDSTFRNGEDLPIRGPYYSWSRRIQPVEELDEEKETKGSTRNLPARMIDTVNINTK